VTPTALLALLLQHGIMLRADNNALHYRAPKGALSEELRQAMQDQKAALLALLTPDPYGADAAAPARKAGVRLVDAMPSCLACGTTRRWRSVYGVDICGRCHPPAAPALVVAWHDGAIPKARGDNSARLLADTLSPTVATAPASPCTNGSALPLHTEHRPHTGSHWNRTIVT
jgi:hypothetical protein